MAKKDKRLVAHELYVTSGWSQKRIAEYLNVSEKTIYKWKKADNWDVQKTANRVTPVKTIGQLMRLLDQMTERNLELEKVGKLEYKQVHALRELINAIRELKGDVSLTVYLVVMTEFMDYFIEQSEVSLSKEEKVKVASLIDGFVVSKSYEFSPDEGEEFRNDMTKLRSKWP